MKEQIRTHIENIFENAPKTKKINELKEELYLNLCDKFDDLIKEGKNEDEAYKTVIMGIGDVNELIKALRSEEVLDYTKIENDRKKTALVISGAVGLYIFSLITLIALSAVFNVRGEISVLFFFGIAAVATCMLVYHFVSRPKYIRADETLVEEFKEWKSENTKKKKVKSSISSIVWTLIVAIYFIVSFAFGAWAYSWIIFIIGAAIEGLINLLFSLND